MAWLVKWLTRWIVVPLCKGSIPLPRPNLKINQVKPDFFILKKNICRKIALFEMNIYNSLKSLLLILFEYSFITKLVVVSNIPAIEVALISEFVTTS